MRDDRTTAPSLSMTLVRAKDPPSTDITEAARRTRSADQHRLARQPELVDLHRRPYMAAQAEYGRSIGDLDSWWPQGFAVLEGCYARVSKPASA